MQPQKNLEICLLSDSYPTERYQEFIFVQQLVEALVNLGHKVSVIAPQSVTKAIVRGRGLLPRKHKGKTSKGIEYAIYRPLYFTTSGNNLLKKLVEKSKISAIKRIVKHEHFSGTTVFYGHFWHNAYALYQSIDNNHKHIFVACGEGDNALEELCESFSQDEKVKFTESVIGVISVSSLNKEKCLNLGLCDTDKIRVFPNAVDKTKFHPIDKRECRQKLNIPIDSFVISFVGGFIYRKGSSRLAEAVNQIDKDDIKVLFIGKPIGGDDATPLCNKTAFMGQINHNDLPIYLNASDLFVLPTLKEGCCNAIVEALSCGIPVVSSDGRFNDDILDESCAIRVNPMDVQQIQDAIMKLYRDRELLNKLSTGSKQKSIAWDINHRAANIATFINERLVLVDEC